MRYGRNIGILNVNVIRAGLGALLDMPLLPARATEGSSGNVITHWSLLNTSAEKSKGKKRDASVKSVNIEASVKKVAARRQSILRSTRNQRTRSINVAVTQDARRSSVRIRFAACVWRKGPCPGVLCQRHLDLRVPSSGRRDIQL